MRDDMLEFAGRVNLIQRNLEMMAVSLESATELLKTLMMEVRLAPPEPPRRPQPSEIDWDSNIIQRRDLEQKLLEQPYTQLPPPKKRSVVDYGLQPGRIALRLAAVNPKKQVDRAEVETYLEKRGIVLSRGKLTQALSSQVTRNKLKYLGGDKYLLTDAEVAAEKVPMDDSRYPNHLRKIISEKMKARFAAMTPTERQARQDRLEAGKKKARMKKMREQRKMQQQQQAGAA